MPHYLKLHIGRAAVFILFVGGIFSSCDFITEPNPPVNSNTRLPGGIKPAKIIGLDHKVISPGQAFPAGSEIQVVFVPDIDLSEIDHIDLVIGSTHYGHDFDPTTFTIDMFGWSSGEHAIYFYVYKKTDNLGMMALLVPSQAYSIVLTIT